MLSLYGIMNVFAAVGSVCGHCARAHIHVSVSSGFLTKTRAGQAVRSPAEKMTPDRHKALYKVPCRKIASHLSSSAQRRALTGLPALAAALGIDEVFRATGRLLRAGAELYQKAAADEQLLHRYSVVQKLLPGF